MRTGSSFVTVARATLAYTLFVILFGAVVRITGSGAGCGQHWPTCHGEVVHLPQRLETVIELTHRVTSGGALLAVLWLAVAAMRTFPRWHRVRAAAYAAVALMLVEALIGAALVLFELVAGNASVGRAFVMPLHLVSTYALTAVLTLACYWGTVGASSASTSTTRRTPLSKFAFGALALVVVSALGAITALGDTVAPPNASSLAERLLEDQGTGATFLQRLRIVHPVLAVLTAAGIARHALHFAGLDQPRTTRLLARAVIGYVLVQLGVGVLNVLFSAPGWLQVLHLAVALGLWLSFVALAATAREASASETGAAPTESSP